MSERGGDRKTALMVAYTNYQTDPRVVRAAQAAVEAGFEVDFIALRKDGEEDEQYINGVRVIRLAQTRYRGGRVGQYVIAYLIFFFRCLVRITRLHIRRRYSVVHVNNMPDFLVFSAIVPKLLGAKIFLDIHDPMPNTFASKFGSGNSGALYKLLLWQEQFSAWFADRVLTVHDPVKDHILVKQHGLDPDRIEVVANFADDVLFALREPRPYDGRLRLVFHGTILERYGLRDAMIALSKVRNLDKITLKIIGEGDFSEELKKLISSVSLNRVVDFDNQMYPLPQLPSILAEYNMGFVPLEISSITEYALPVKLLEYLSLGMPSVTIWNAAIAYYFGENDCLFFEAGKPQSLTSLLNSLVEQPEMVIHYQRRAAVLRERFLWAREKEKYIKLLQLRTT